MARTRLTETERMAKWLDEHRNGFTVGEFCAALGYERQLAAYDILPALEQAAALFTQPVTRCDLSGCWQDTGYFIWSTWQPAEMT